MNLQNIEFLKPTGLFTNYIYKAIPLVFDESMSYYETLLGLLAYLKNTVIPTVNNNADAVAELQKLFTELKSFVDNYFDNLDVQQEINNKLDQMVEDGTLDNILNNYINVTKVYNTHQELMQDTGLVNNMKVKTLGYYEINDGGEAYYYITNNENVNEYQEQTSVEGLFATLIIQNDNINIKQLGAKGDGETDDTQPILKALELNVKIITFKNGIYNITDNINIDNKIINGNDSTIQTISQLTQREHQIHVTNQSTINNLTFKQNNQTVALLGLFNCVNTSFNNCNFIVNKAKTNGYVDLYTNNNNIHFNNCLFDCYSLNTSNELDIGGVWIREGTEGKTSSNIYIDNCKFSQASIDEILAIWDWFGKVENVFISNCTFDDKNGIGTMPHFISLSANKIIMNSCEIIRDSNLINSSIIKNDSNYIPIISNCDINTNSSNSVGLLNGVFNIFSSNFNINTVTNLSSRLSSQPRNTIINSCKINAKNLVIENIDILNSNITFTHPKTSGYMLRRNISLINNQFFGINISGSAQFIQLFENVDYIYIINNFFDFQTNLTYFIFATSININYLKIINNNNLSGNLYGFTCNNGIISNNTITTELSSIENIKYNNNFNIS